MCLHVVITYISFESAALSTKCTQWLNLCMLYIWCCFHVVQIHTSVCSLHCTSQDSPTCIKSRTVHVIFSSLLLFCRWICLCIHPHCFTGLRKSPQSANGAGSAKHCDLDPGLLVSGVRAGTAVDVEVVGSTCRWWKEIGLRPLFSLAVLCVFVLIWAQVWIHVHSSWWFLNFKSHKF